MNVLGLKIVGHDTGAALISGERVVAIAEERLNRVKHSPYMFPERAIEYCLEALHVKPEDIGLIVIDQVFQRDRYPMRDIFLGNVGNRFPNARVEVINHHDAHAASAFFCSPFEEAAVMVYDGLGEVYRGHLGVETAEAETLYAGLGNQLTQIKKTAHLWKGRNFYHTCGPAKLYELISDRYLGFGRYNEGKLMGLAPYGKPTLFDQFPLDQWYREFHGSVVCNARLSWPLSPVVQRRDPAILLQRLASLVRKTTRKLLRPLTYALARRVIPSQMVALDPLFPKIHLSRPPRDESTKLPDDYYSSVAYAVQHVLERVAMQGASTLRDATQSPNICIAGGCGLNIDANTKFLTEAGFKHIFVQPGASDTGIPLGCALFGYHMILQKPRFFVMKNASLGRRYQESEIQSAIKKYQNQLTITKSKNISGEVAELIAHGNIIGWFQGGGEYGPRALGNRSILCNAAVKDMKDILNNRVKHRESWRPFAAAVLRERMQEYFELEEESPFMLLVAPVKKEKRHAVPSIVHVDGTCRVQSVTREANGRYYDVIKEFARITGIPLILNTSFNLGGDPIVETPDDTIRCFLATHMDYLVLEDYLIQKRQPTEAPSR